MPVSSYNLYSRWLHWLIAGLIIFMVFLGWRMDDHDTLRSVRAALHESVGLSVLILSVVRLALRLVLKAPPDVEGPKWQMFAAKTLHVGFYVLIIGLPLSGWLMVSTLARPIPFFGLFTWPHLPMPQSHDLHEQISTIHGLLAKLIIYAMIPLHILAALKHQFVDKDAVMQHMLPGLTPKSLLNWRWIIPVGVVALAIAAGYMVDKGTPQPGGDHPHDQARPAQIPATKSS
ncbi:cytochrome b [Asticcacaulis sp. EMRT-3]|uniref:cytochrome b n=1 Tax=Asticcacaulis sp. EMRT-3 TaxID=3040349 RepID=UPI0024AF2897|nr:cytochrome b [Asticcacaulis sp. EMRT-3]MDI7774754.1 cytochrome b [Asticcacaulis sp. EMRT-3]